MTAKSAANAFSLLSAIDDDDDVDDNDDVSDPDERTDADASGSTRRRGAVSLRRCCFTAPPCPRGPGADCRSHPGPVPQA